MPETHTSPASAFAALRDTVPSAPPAIANYSTIRFQREFVFTSGHPPIAPDGTMITGQVGGEIDVAAGYTAARYAGLALLATLDAHIESLDDINSIVKLTVMVNAVPGFTQHAEVANGCSDVLSHVFAGLTPPARTAFGVSSLPLNIAIEAELIATIRHSHQIPPRG